MKKKIKNNISVNELEKVILHKIYILGGHKLAYSYFEKITQAKREGLIQFQNLFCVTNDQNSYAVKHLPRENIMPFSAADFIYEKIFSEPEKIDSKDVLVPDHTAKHVLLQAFMTIVEKAFPEYKVEFSPFESDFQTPFLYKSENDALWAMSYATWTCPPDCPEPEVCPHIQNKRDWDFFKALPEEMKKYSSKDYSVHLFSCEAFVEQISQIPMAKIAEEMTRFVERLKHNPPQKVIVATHSHCHGILGQLRLISTNSSSF